MKVCWVRAQRWPVWSGLIPHQVAGVARPSAALVESQGNVDLDRDAATVESFFRLSIISQSPRRRFFAWRPALPDPDDDFILELAVAAGCRYIVTHNVRDFRRSEKWGIRVITPSDFLELIKTQT